MVPLKDDKSNLFDLTDFAFASEVVKSHPKIISIYDKLLPVLYHFAAYQCVWPVIEVVEESKTLAEMQLAFYSKIFKSKGRIDDQK